MATITNIDNLTSKDKFKIWLEKINSLNANVVAINAELDKKAPLSHASKNKTYGIGTSALYGHLRLTDTISDSLSATNGTAISPLAVFNVQEIANKAKEDASQALTDITEINTKIETIQETAKGFAPINHASIETKYGLATFASGSIVAQYGHVKLSNDLTASSATFGIAATPYAVSQVNTKITNVEALLPKDNNDKYISVAPEYHASTDTKYGLGTALLYGHIKLTDDVTTANGASTSIGASQKAVNTVYTYAQGIAKDLANLDKAPEYHASSDTTYGVGNSSLYGHLKLSDAIDNSASNEDSGTAATPKAVADVYAYAQSISSSAESLEKSKAPVYHASTETKYGIGNATLYGHLKLSDTLSDTDNADKGIAATPALVSSTAKTLAPLNHASSATTYGLATNSLYGHVKITDTYSSEVTGDGIVPTQKAIFDTYTVANNALTLAESNEDILDNAIEKGQIQNIVKLSNTDSLNTLLETGNYYTTTPSTTNNFPYNSTDGMYIVNVYKTDDDKTYQVITSEDSIYTRIYDKNGTGWSEWNSLYTSADNDLQNITSKDLNDITTTGNYISTSASIDLHYPYSSDDSSAYTLIVYSSPDNTYQLLTSENSVWVRFKETDTWKCLSSNKELINVYISTDGSDDNDGLTLDTAVKTFNRAIEISKIYTNRSSDNTINFYFNSNLWENVKFSNFNSRITINAIAENTPIIKLTVENSTVTLKSNIKCYLELKNNSFVNIEKGTKVGFATIKVDNSTLVFEDGSTIEIYNTNTDDSVISLTNHGGLYINSCKLDNKETIYCDKYLFVDSYSYIKIDNSAVITGSKATGTKYYITAFSNAICTKAKLDSLLSDVSGVLEVNAIVNGVPYGGGSKETFLRDDLTWGVPNQKTEITAVEENDYTITEEDRNKLLVVASESDITVPEDLPKGFDVTIKNISDETLTIIPTGDILIDNSSEPLVVYPGETYQIVKYSDDEKWVVSYSTSVLGELSVSDVYSK